MKSAHNVYSIFLYNKKTESSQRLQRALAEDRVSSAGIGFGDNASENHASRLGYTGHQSDSGSSLTYMQQRHYDPVIGRFMCNDSVGFTTSNPMIFNRYAYANNNPYMYVDPDGRYASDYTAANVEQFINSEASMLLESGVARAVHADTFFRIEDYVMLKKFHHLSIGRINRLLPTKAANQNTYHHDTLTVRRLPIFRSPTV